VVFAAFVQRARAENFGNLNKLIELHTIHWLQKNEGQCPISCMKERAKNLKGNLLKDFSYNMKNHNECVSHCMEWCLSNDRNVGIITLTAVEVSMNAASYLKI